MPAMDCLLGVDQRGGADFDVYKSVEKDTGPQGEKKNAGVGGDGRAFPDLSELILA